MQVMQMISPEKKGFYRKGCQCEARMHGMQEWRDSWKARHQHSNAVPPRLFTVGRLDVASTGLIFVTNDGGSLYNAPCFTSLHILSSGLPLGNIPCAACLYDWGSAVLHKMCSRPFAELLTLRRHLTNRVLQPLSGEMRDPVVICIMQPACGNLEALLGSAPRIPSGGDALQASGHKGCSIHLRA